MPAQVQTNPAFVQRVKGPFLIRLQPHPTGSAVPRTPVISGKECLGAAPNLVRHNADAGGVKPRLAGHWVQVVPRLLFLPRNTFAIPGQQRSV